MFMKINLNVFYGWNWEFYYWILVSLGYPTAEEIESSYEASPLSLEELIEYEEKVSFLVLIFNILVILMFYEQIWYSSISHLRWHSMVFTLICLGDEYGQTKSTQTQLGR